MQTGKSLIQNLMEELLRSEEPAVFRVSLSRSDHSTHWVAFAQLRADDYGRAYQAEAPTPEMALGELKKVINSILCPYCHQPLPEESDD